VDALSPLLIWANALPLWFFFTFSGYFTVGDLAAATKVVQL
jgi:hypothetical protein